MMIFVIGYAKLIVANLFAVNLQHSVYTPQIMLQIKTTSICLLLFSHKNNMLTKQPTVMMTLVSMPISVRYLRLR